VPGAEIFGVREESGVGRAETLRERGLGGDIPERAKMLPTLGGQGPTPAGGPVNGGFDLLAKVGGETDVPVGAGGFIRGEERRAQAKLPGGVLQQVGFDLPVGEQ
jgi:hypothetical protein